MESNSQDPKLEQNQKEKPMSIRSKSLLTGFIGGLFWATIGSIAYYFNFSEVSHGSFILRSFFEGNWTNGLLGEIISIVIVGLISILIALLYYLTLRKRPGMIPGFLYGIALWVIIMYFLNPVFSAVPTLSEMESTTIVSTLCLYILYGTFIGYSISYEYEAVKKAEANKKKSSQNAS
ncbi:YqhR family membrane protein [Salirhabdus sp. Marseille-P4669]|uniref:YqhR family membrane protein n=1 Tax=Salirhabdus sp. Marseille-P4669 TaxID=2042310 RepID=UPI000C7C2D5C|nr:YqhR family membrane protein [Salirhabdus sp. Marseille-P4669]